MKVRAEGDVDVGATVETSSLLGESHAQLSGRAPMEATIISSIRDPDFIFIVRLPGGGSEGGVNKSKCRKVRRRSLKN